MLQAWLGLAQSSASDNVPFAARVHALTQSWSEPEVTWAYRNKQLNMAWTTPGGTRLPYATGRQFVSTKTNSTNVRWQVGPIVNEWHLGLLANQGLLIACDRDPGDDEHEVLFRSTEYTSTPSKTPSSSSSTRTRPPRSGEATWRSSRTRSCGLRNIPLRVWLDVLAADTTASGLSTGFDEIMVAHNGALRGTEVDSVLVDGQPIPAGQITVTDNGTSLTVRTPRIRTNGKIRIVLRADVLAAASSTPLELPVYVDDTSTPAPASQCSAALTRTELRGMGTP